MTRLRPGMRVVVKEGPWEEPRVAGHYGKIVEVYDLGDEGLSALVDITGHVDGNPAYDGIWDDWYAEELDVVD